MLDNLKQVARKIYPEESVEKIRDAYNIANKAHKGQLRSSGEEFIVHPVQVAHILMDLGLDADTVIAGLLHDVIEDTDMELEEIREIFGNEVAILIDGVTKLGRIEYTNKQERQAESLRKMFLAMAKDIRVIIIKLSDRLHNLRTLEYIDEAKQREKAHETLEIYAPLAHRLGIYRIKMELEDTSLRYIDPKGYYDLVEKVAAKRKEREAYIDQGIKVLHEKFDEMGIEAEIEGRAKHFYSIYKKMYMQHRDFDQIYDLLAIRVIVESVKDCYAVLGTVHTLWKPIPGRFKDYIAMPKPNMYQSLHTTVIGLEGEIFEIQIRTIDMHKTAEYGIAAHWKYKEGKQSNTELDSKLAWLREILEWQRDLKDASEFMESLKIDLFTDEVFVFTPKGDVIDLPRGAISLDFAYAIHSDIGNRCQGAKVNGKLMPLDYELETGDIVEIMTSSSSRPSRDWLSLVKTNQARNKIRQWFKKEDKEENTDKGREMLERGAKRQGYVFSELAKPKWLEMVARKHGYSSIEDVYAAVGYNGLRVNQVLTRLINEYKKSTSVMPPADAPIDVSADTKGPISHVARDTGVVVRGVDNIKVRFAKCCNPVPGDDIIGYITRGRGVSVHRSDCINVIGEDVEEHRLIEVEWVEADKASYFAEIRIVADDRHSLLADISLAIANMKLNVTAINARTTKNKEAIINLILEIGDISQLNRVMKQFRRLRSVSKVSRVNG